MSLFAVLKEDGSYAITQFGFASLVILIILLLIGACFLSNSEKNVRLGIRKIAFSAVAIALALVTSMIKIFHLPFGGSITLFSMLFICLIGYWYGLRSGLMAAVAYGLLQMLIDPYFMTVPQILTDYVLAFGALGISGLFSDKPNGLTKGYILGVTGRFLFSCLSGYIFFGEYAPEGVSPLFYTIAYNGSYIFTEVALTLVLINLPSVKNAFSTVKRIALQY